MTKKIISSAAVFLLAAVLLTVPVFTGGSVKDYEYSVGDDGGITITAYNGNSTNVAIPDMLDGKPVRAIGEGVFAGHTEISGLYISEGVIKIGASAFAGCSALTSLYFPASLAEIGDDAFSDCISLAEINFTSGLTKIGARTFFDCAALGYVQLPSTLAYIGENAFSGSTSPEYIAVTNPSPTAEYGAGSFGKAKIFAFSGSSAETFAAEQKLGFSALAPVSSLNYVLSGGGIKITSCTGNTEAVVVPDSIGTKNITAIGEGAFSAAAGRCLNTRIIILPDTVKTINNSAFSGSTALEQIRLSRSIIGDMGQYTFKGCTSLESVIIPEGTEKIGLDAFRDCTALYRVTLPASVTFISAGAFRNCSSLKELICEGSEPVCEYKNTLAALVSFAGVADMTVYIRSGTNWSLTDGKWYPNGTSPEYSGYRAVMKKCDCFYIEKIIETISCAHEGISEFWCPFCGQSYTETYPMTEHIFVSTGIIDGIETYRCTGCTESYVRYHMAYAIISPIINPENPKGSMMASASLTFRTTELVPGKDYTYTETYNETYNRVELVFTGEGEYLGVRRFAYSLTDSRWLTAYTVTAAGASGAGQYYPNDLVLLKADTAPEGMKAGTWSITNGVSFMSKGELGASFIMPSKDVAVTLTFKEIEVTTTPVTTKPVPDTEEPTVTETEQITVSDTEPATEPPDSEPVTTDPFITTPIAKPYIKKAIIWGSVLFVSLAALAGVSIILMKKDKNQE